MLIMLIQYEYNKNKTFMNGIILLGWQSREFPSITWGLLVYGHRYHVHEQQVNWYVISKFWDSHIGETFFHIIECISWGFEFVV